MGGERGRGELPIKFRTTIPSDKVLPHRSPRHRVRERFRRVREWDYNLFIIPVPRIETDVRYKLTISVWALCVSSDLVQYSIYTLSSSHYSNLDSAPNFKNIQHSPFLIPPGLEESPNSISRVLIVIASMERENEIMGELIEIPQGSSPHSSIPVSSAPRHRTLKTSNTHPS